MFRCCEGRRKRKAFWEGTWKDRDMIASHPKGIVGKSDAMKCGQVRCGVEQEGTDENEPPTSKEGRRDRGSIPFLFPFNFDSGVSSFPVPPTSTAALATSHRNLSVRLWLPNIMSRFAHGSMESLSLHHPQSPYPVNILNLLSCFAQARIAVTDNPTYTSVVDRVSLLLGHQLFTEAVSRYWWWRTVGL